MDTSLTTTVLHTTSNIAAIASAIPAIQYTTAIDNNNNNNNYLNYNIDNPNLYKDIDLEIDIGFLGFNSSNYTNSKMSSSGSADTSSSTSAFVTTFIVNSITATCFFTAFILLRQKFKRLYQPRTLKDINSISDAEKIEEAPQGFIQWLPYLLQRPHSFFIQNCGVDGYFFLRYLCIFVIFSFISGCILFPILLPVNATNGNNLQGFEILAYSNVTNKNRLYAHVFLSWIIYGMFLFILYKELYHYIVFRHALQTTPLYDGLLSSRTIILTELNENLAFEGELEKIFPKVNKVTFAHDLKELDDLCNERTKNFNKLEGAINSVLNKSVKKKFKNDKKLEKGKKVKNQNLPSDDLETYVPLKKRPTHRIGPWWLPPMEFLFGRKKVQTIPYCAEEIAKLNEKVTDAQDDWQYNKRLPAAFLEFNNQLDAQVCYQSVNTILGRFSFGKKFIGIAPDSICWENLNLSSKTRYLKYIGANTFLTAMIIFWAIPTAVVGCISNVNFLTTKVPFLRFINNMPTFLLGIITGLLPTICLAILMSLVPPIIKKAGSISGTLTKEELSSFTQKWYYTFQVIQVFLVTTLASSASATVEAIINDPGSAMTLLANNLPKASNFYITYFLLLGLSGPTGSLLQIVNLVLYHVFSFMDGTPRAKWIRYNTLSKPDYSLVYPSVQILVCIFMTYIIISPIMLVFSTFALLFTFIAYLYNNNYVNGFPANDARGINYIKALFQAMCPVYLSQVCLIGLFIMSKSWGPLVLEVVALAVTAVIHCFYKWWFLPIIDYVPISVIKIARGEIDSSLYPASDLGRSEIKKLVEHENEKYKENLTGGIIRDATEWELKHADLLPSNSSSSTPSEKPGVWSEADSSVLKKTEHDRRASTVTGATLTTTFVPDDEKFRKYTYKDVASLQREQDGEEDKKQNNGPQREVMEKGDVGNIFADPDAISQTPSAFPPNTVQDKTFFQKFKLFFQPKKACQFDKVRASLPHIFNSTIEYDEDFVELAYTNPCVSEKEPIVWICKDPMGLSKQQIEEARDIGVAVSDDNTEYDDKGKPQYTGNPPNYELEIKR